MEAYLPLSISVLVIFLVFMALSFLWMRRQKHVPLAEMEFATEPSIIDGNMDDLAVATNTSTSLQESAEVSHLEPSIKPAVTDDFMNDLLVLSVIAKPDMQFASYELFQAISTTGMQFGEMNIFHYYDITKNGKIKLFSLASATKPGEFDLNRMGEFSCVGLTLFTRLQDVPDPQESFDLMLQTAKQLADDLDGELHAKPRQLWSEDIHNEYCNKVLFYQK